MTMGRQILEGRRDTPRSMDLRGHLIEFKSFRMSS